MLRRRLDGPAPDLFQDLVQLLVERLGDRLGFLAGELAGHHELLGVQLADADPILDLLVHDRLGEAGLIALVVPVTPVADHVDDHILAERRPEVERQLGDGDHGLRVLAVDVEDRHLDHLGDVGAVRGRPPLAGRGGEADLVVHHDMDGAAGLVTRELREVQRLGDQALAGEGRIAVDQDRQAQPAIPVLEPPLLGPHPPLDDRVDRLEMARVGRQGQVHRVLVGRDVIGREAQVILDVPVAGHRLGQVAFELVEDQAIRLVQDVRQDVQASTVRHPHHDLAHPLRPGPLDDRVQERDQHLAPLEREPFLPDVIPVEERLEQFRGVQLVDDPPLLLDVEVGLVPRRLHPVQEPSADILVADVHELDADRAAIGLAQDGDHLAQGGCPALRLAQPVVEFPIEVGFVEPERRQLQHLDRFASRAEFERVEVGQVMAVFAVGGDQPGDGRLRFRGVQVDQGGAAGRTDALLP